MFLSTFVFVNKPTSPLLRSSDNELCLMGNCSHCKSNQIKVYLYSTFLNDFWSSQSAVHIIKIPYKTLYSKYNSTVCTEYQYEKTTPSVLRPSHRTRKNFQRTTHSLKGKMGETSGRASEEGSLSQDGQTCNRCRV